MMQQQIILLLINLIFAFELPLDIITLPNQLLKNYGIKEKRERQKRSMNFNLSSNFMPNILTTGYFYDRSSTHIYNHLVVGILETSAG